MQELDPQQQAQQMMVSGGQFGPPAPRPQVADGMDFSAVGPQPPATVPQIPQGQPVALPGAPAPAATPEALIAGAAQSARQDAHAEKQVAANATQAAQQDADIAKAESAQLEPVYADQVAHEQEFQQHVQNFQAEAQRHMALVQQQMQDLDKQVDQNIARAPKSIWEQADLQPVLGTIALALSGIGSQILGGPNQMAQNIQQRIEARVARDRHVADVMNEKRQGLQTEYGMIREQLGDDIGAETTLANSYARKVIAQIQEQANLFKSPKAQANANALIAQLQQGILDRGARRDQNAFQNFAKGQELLLAQQHLGLQAQLGAQKAAGQPNAIAGFVGSVPDNEHPRLAKMVGGARATIQELGHLQDLIRHGVNAPAIRDFMVNNSALVAGLRDWAETGTRLEPGEQALIDALKPGAFESFVTGMSKHDFLGLADKIRAAQQAIARSAITKVQTAAPGIQVDAQDPFWESLRGDDAQSQARDILRAGTPEAGVPRNRRGVPY